MPVLAPESSAALVIAAALASESSLQWAAGGQCPGGHLPAAQSVLAFLGPPPLGQATRDERTAGGAAHQKGYGLTGGRLHRGAASLCARLGSGTQ